MTTYTVTLFQRAERDALIELYGLTAAEPGRGQPMIAPHGDGWALLNVPGADAKPPLAPSNCGDVVVLHRNAGAMVSWAYCYRDFEEVWQVEHDCQRGVEHLDYEGDLPPGSQEVVDRAMAEQDVGSDVDYLLDVAADVVALATGFRLDPEAGWEPVQVKPGAER